MEWNHASTLEAGNAVVSPRASSTSTSEGKILKDGKRRKTKKAAEFMSFDSDHWIFHRFEKLSLFNILCLQQELVDYEKKLELALKKECINDDVEFEELENLIRQIREKLKEYEDALFSQSRHKDFRKPPKQTLSLLKDYCKEKKLDLNREFALASDDEGRGHVAIGNRDKTWIHRFVDHHECLRNKFAQRASKDAPSSLMFYSESAVRRAETIVLNLLFCFLLLCPIITLSFVHGKLEKLAVVFCFVLAASVVASDLSNAANKANMAVIAGYSAILVVALTSTLDS